MIPPFPYWRGDPEDFDPVENEEDILFGRPELLGQIKLRPIGATEADDADFEVPIVFFSAFERVNLTPDKPMQRILDIQQLYEPGLWPSSVDPIMHVGLLMHVLGRAPLVPLFLQGNSTATIPHGMCNLRSRFPNDRADSPLRFRGPMARLSMKSLPSSASGCTPGARRCWCAHRGF